VKSIRIIAAFVMALLWAPLTSHCQLESIPGFEFLHCPSEATSSGCCDDSCTTIESGSYKVPEHHNLVPLLYLVAAFHLATITETDLLAEPGVRVVDGPISLSSTWQFSFRTALPVRAPSVVS